MASPVLQKLSPKSPLSFKQSFTKTFNVGVTTNVTAPSSRNFLQVAVSAPSKPQTYRTSATPDSHFLSPRLNVFLNGRKSEDGTTPKRLSDNSYKPSPDSPGLVNSFLTTSACDALVQSPCRLEKFRHQRRRLYHQDSFEEYGSVGSAPGSANSFQSTPKLGKGGFGSVFIGKYDGKLVAIKQLHNSQKDRINGESLCAELNAFKLTHPNIIQILTFTCSGSAIQIVSEYVGRRNLHKVLDDLDEKIDFDRRLRFCREIAGALSYCHENRVLHLDVKPANVLITDTTDVCKLADFGCSRCLPIDSDTAPVTPSGSSMAGTLIYKAPELLRGLPASAKCDVYSYGYVVWQIVTRHQPFEDLDPHTVVFCVVAKNLRPSVKDGEWSTHTGDVRLLEIARKCWDPNPEIRPTFEKICVSLAKL